MFCSSSLLSQRLQRKYRCSTAPRITKENGTGSDNYPWTLANLAAALVVCQTEELPAEEVGGPVAEEEADAHEIPESGDPESQRFLQDVRGKLDHTLLRRISKLHDQYGHPSPRMLVSELAKQRCPKEWIMCAEIYICFTCFGAQKPSLSKVVRLPVAQFFNHVLDTDNVVVKREKRNRRIQSMLDEHTRFEADARLRRESAKDETKNLQKLWSQWAGPPVVLRKHLSEYFRKFCEAYGIKADLMPKFAHHKLAFLEANFRQSVRRALLARSRPMRREFVIGEWAFYWRVIPDEGDSSLVNESAWEGPSVVCSGEPPRDPAMSIMDRCYWLIHGAALLRCTHEQLREETPEERLASEGPTVLRPSPEQTLRDLRERLSRVRGPVRYVDISGKSNPHAAGAEAPAPPGDQPPPASAAGLAPPPGPEPPPVTPRGPAAPSTAELFMPEPATPSAAVPSSPKREFPTSAVREIQRQRSAAGEPPLQRLSLEVAEGSVVPPEDTPVIIPVPESDEELRADVNMLEDGPEAVFLVRKGSNAIVMSRLSPNERALFRRSERSGVAKVYQPHRLEAVQNRQGVTGYELSDAVRAQVEVRRERQQAR